MEEFAYHLAEDAARVAAAWLSSLAQERRVAEKTVEAYRRDLSQFGAFLTDHLGEATQHTTIRMWRAWCLLAAVRIAVGGA